jgi:hypothetical protein
MEFWMLSMIDNQLFRSKHGRMIEQEEIDRCAFAVPTERNEMIRKSPPILQMPGSGQNCPFM